MITILFRKLLLKRRDMIGTTGCLLGLMPIYQSAIYQRDSKIIELQALTIYVHSGSFIDVSYNKRLLQRESNPEWLHDKLSINLVEDCRGFKIDIQKISTIDITGKSNYLD